MNVLNKNKKLIKVKYQQFYPAGNPTAIVTTLIPKNIHPNVSIQLMSENNTLEQVGFVNIENIMEEDYQLQMMGGEFCANAIASASAALLFSNLNKSKPLNILASGSLSKVKAEVENNTVNLFIPVNYKLSDPLIINNMNVIYLLGVTHIIIHMPPPEEALKKAKILINSEFINKEYTDAIVITYLYRVDLNYNIYPIVWVKETNTYIQESSCGSGSIAASIVIAQSSNMSNLSLDIFQPSGKKISISWREESNYIDIIDMEIIVDHVATKTQNIYL